MNSVKKLEEMEVQNEEVLSNGTTSAKEIGNKPLISHIQLDETPFYMVIHEEEGIFICMGNYRMHEEPFNSQLEAEEWARKMDWNKLLVVIELAVKTLVKEESLKTLEQWK